MSNRSILRPALWILFLYILEVTFADRLGIFAPPLVLAAVISMALERGSMAGLTAGLVSGFLFEPFAPGAFGSISFAYGFVGYISGTLSSKIFGESVWVRTVWPCAAMAAALAIEVLGGRGAGAPSFWETWFSMLQPARFLSMAAVTPLVATAVNVRPRHASRHAVYS